MAKSRSEFIRTVLRLQKEIDAISADDNGGDVINEIVSELDSLRDELQEKYETMEERFGDSNPTTVLLEARLQWANDMIDQLADVGEELSSLYDAYTDRLTEIRDGLDWGGPE